MKAQSNHTLIPRPEAYDLYWYFAYERHQIFERRLQGEPAPWTHDPILQEYKFCNSYRALDRVSQYLIHKVIYRKDDSTPDDRLFQIIAFRMFSNIETWQSIIKILGRPPHINDLITGKFESTLNQVKADNGKLYTNAFILCATNAYGRQLKHLNHVELFKDMFINHNLGERLRQAVSLEDIYLMLHEFPLIGDFMAYQLAIDLNYSDYIDFSENDFTQPGPGALRGIKKVFADTGDMSPREIIMWMVEHQDEEFARLGYNFKGLFGRKLTAIDCQNIFCETDKYLRVAHPELASARVKIKTKFTDTQNKLEFFLPPKWNLEYKR